MPDLSFAESIDQIAGLVRHFGTNRAAYLAPSVKEAHIRQSLIDPFFIALGWDVHNVKKVAPQYCPVIVEPSLDMEGQRQIDALVYELYGLTDDEIKIVEEARPSAERGRRGRILPK